MLMALAPLALLMLLSLLLSAFAAWLTTVSAKPIRAWTEHPWRVFWISYLFLLLGGILGALGLRLIGIPVVVCAAIVTVLSSIHGLGLTWRRSATRGALVVAAGFGMAMAGAVGRYWGTPELVSLGFETFAVVFGTAWWIVLAVVADRLARRFNARMARLQTPRGGHGGEP